MSGGAPELLQSYEVVGKLREGGMGALYRVRHRLLEQERVVKILRPQLGGDADFRARFLREAQLVARLRHPNLALLHEFALAESGAGCIVMEFIDGLSLKDLLDTSGPPSIGLAMTIARQSLAALGYLHRGGILHRDISTDNLMLTRDHDGGPLVKLIDLGIAKRTGDAEQTRLTATGAFLGKVRYASPEQFRGDATAIDERSDLYSFGIVLYELLTGAFPLTGESANSLIAGHLFQEPRPFSETDPSGRVPEALRAAVLRALAKRREDRFRSAADFDAALAPLAARHAPQPQELERILAHTPPAPSGGGEDLSAALSTLPARDLGGESTVVMPPTQVTAPRQASTVLLEDSPRARRRRRGWWIAGFAVAAGAIVGMTWQLWPPKDDRTGTANGERTGAAGETAESAESDDALLRRLLAPGKAHALVIGNSDYAAMVDLPSAVGDARAVGDLLESRYGFVVERLYDASRPEILGALERYESALGEADRLLVYYAGHGEEQVAADGRSESRVGFWLPVEAGPGDAVHAIPNSEITDRVKGMRARQVLIVADSCYAGTIGLDELAAAPADATPAARRRRLEAMVAARAWLAMASGGTRPVPERADGRSIFAQAVVEVLSENRAALGAGELFARLRPLVESASLLGEGEKQVPTLKVIPGLRERGEFFFVPSDTVEPSGASS